MKTFRPMLAATYEAGMRLRFPVLASPKLDGIRCLVHPELGPVSRNLKQIPNRFVREFLRTLPPLDGELIVGDPLRPDTWNASQFGIMSEKGEPDFTYWVFDRLPFGIFEGLEFSTRIKWVQKTYEQRRDPDVMRSRYIAPVVHATVDSEEALAAYEAGCVEAGFEGVMLRDPAGLYKFGRSTVREGGLLKVKRFHDAEAVVRGTVERMHNGNAARVNALGLTERSTHKANKVGTDTLGALVCEFRPPFQDGLGEPVRFELGTGFDDAMRAKLWADREYLPGQAVKFKYQMLSPDGVPRFPVWLGFRDARDA